MKFLILGGGTQGSAAAYDLLRDDDVEEVVLADARPGQLHQALKPHLGRRLRTRVLEAESEDAVREAMAGMTGVLCALP